MFILAILLMAAPASAGQPAAPRDPHIGYAYPAGGEQGKTFRVTVGGQFLDGVSEASVTGTGVSVKVVEYDKPMPQPQAMRLRDTLAELQAKRAAALGLPPPAKAAAKTGTGGPRSVVAPKGMDATERVPPAPTWTAADEALLVDVRKELATFVRRPTSQAIAEIVTLDVTIAPDAAPGRRELRLGTQAGMTNLLVFYVGQLPEVSQPVVKHAPEATKSAAGREMTVTLPATINGQIMAGGVDRFRFKAAGGQQLVFAASARDLVPYLADAVPGWFQATLALYDAKGNEVAYDDDYRFNPDPVIFFKVPRDGEYVLEIKDSIYRGREDFVYRISAGELPFVTSIFPLGGPAGSATTVDVCGWNLPAAKVLMGAKGSPGVYLVSEEKAGVASNRVPFAVDSLPECLEKEPNSDPAAGQAVTLPIIVNGRIDAPGDADVFRFTGHGGDEIVAEVAARRLGSPLDSILTLTDGAGKILASNDDQDDKAAGLETHHADSYLRATLPADGVYYVRLADTQHKGGPEYAYRLRISPPRPDFALRLAPSSLMVRGGTSTTVTAYALRHDGFTGDIALKLVGAPAGFALSASQIPTGKDSVELKVAVRPMPPKEDVKLHLEGRAKIGGEDVVRPVVPAEDMEQAFAYHHLVPADELVAAVRPPVPAALAASPNLRAATMMLARYIAQEVGLQGDKADTFAAAYLAERQAGLERLRAGASGNAKAAEKAAEKGKALLVDNATSMEAVLAANLTPVQAKKARDILGTLSGDTDREVAFLMDARATTEKIQQALPILAKYEVAADREVYSKLLTGLVSRVDGASKMRQLRDDAARDLMSIVGADAATKWADRPALGFGPPAAAAKKK
jgi:hypothetical protein